MARWQPDTRDRLAQAAMQLYLERGYPQTTVAEIAATAGITERTFFRHFADKSEVLFGGTAPLQAVIRQGISHTPTSAPPLEAVVAGLEAAHVFFEGDTSLVRQRQQIIASHPDLQARELHKLSVLGQSIRDSLQARGVFPTEAHLTAETGLLIFRVAFQQWLAADGLDWRDSVQQTLMGLRAVISKV